jgi:RNA polymerase sigma-70 factor (sigma-E family)
MIDQALPDQSTAAEGFDEFFAERYRWAVRGAYLLTYSADAAEDIAQEAFAQMLRRWGEIRKPEAYLWRVVTNGARSWGRRRARRAVPVDLPDDVTFDSDTIAVRDALAELPQAYREALVLRYYGGFREREIAEATGRPIGTVKSHIHRGLAALKERLQ